MKKGQRFIVTTFLLIALAFAALVESNRGEKYPLGMTIGEVRALTAGRYITQKFGVEYEGQPTLQQLNEDPIFYIHDEASGVLLMFNYHERLIVKERTKWFGINVIKFLDSIRPHN